MKTYTFPINDLVAAKPFPELGMETIDRGGFIGSANKNTLIRLAVVHAQNSGWKFIYVTKDDSKHQWATTVYTIGDDKFILVPYANIKLVEVEDGETW